VSAHTAMTREEMKTAARQALHNPLELMQADAATMANTDTRPNSLIATLIAAASVTAVIGSARRRYGRGRGSAVGGNHGEG
jgi:hypothetical protein